MTSDFARRVATAAVVVCAMAGGCHRPSDSRPNVLLICIDALRADHLGAYGASPSPSPALDALARDSAVFENASAVASWTKPSVPSLLTGLYPAEHGVFDNSHDHVDTLSADAVTLASRLSDHGYRTAAFVENEQLRAAVSGLDRGFSLYFDGAGDPPDIVHRFLVWSRATSRGPWFAYLHFLDPHFPYTADAYTWPAKEAGRLRVRSLHWDLRGTSWWLLRERVNDGRTHLDEEAIADLDMLYRQEISAVDAAVGNLLRLLATDGVLRSTVVVVTADHGEGFLEHGRIDHGYGPYAELLRVPLLLRLPGRVYAGTRIDAVVQNVDIAPTILERVGIDIPTQWSSASLLPLLDGELHKIHKVALAQERHGHTQMLGARDRRSAYIRIEDPSEPRVPPAAIPSSATPGTRIRARGIFDGEHLVAAAVKRIAPGDPDTEIEAPIAAIDESGRSVLLLGVRVRVGDGIPAAEDLDHLVGLADLAVGDLVRVHGEFVDDVFMPTKIERLVVEDSIEVEGVIRHVEVLAGGDTAIDLGGAVLLVDPHATWKEFPGQPRVPPRSQAEEVPSVVEQLFDLRTDPSEQEDVAASQPRELERMRALADEAVADLDVPDAAGARRAKLDHDTRERLRALGYVE